MHMDEAAIEAMAPVEREQIKRGGLRLAKLLNSAFRGVKAGRSRVAFDFALPERPLGMRSGYLTPFSLSEVEGQGLKPPDNRFNSRQIPLRCPKEPKRGQA